MKNLSMARGLASVSMLVSLAACGADDPAPGAESNIMAARAETSPPRVRDNMARCQGRRECITAAAIAILFASHLELDHTLGDDFLKGGTPKRAPEFVVKFLGDRHARLVVAAEPSGSGRTAVAVAVATIVETKADLEPKPAGCPTCQLFEEGNGALFGFTIENDEVMESRVRLAIVPPSTR
jgi:hypothetical protein